LYQLCKQKSWFHHGRIRHTIPSAISQVTTRMTVNVRALIKNDLNPPRHRCQLLAARGDSRRSLCDYFPTPYNSHESELERNLMIRTTGPYTTHRHPLASRRRRTQRLSDHANSAVFGIKEGRFTLGHFLSACRLPRPALKVLAAKNSESTSPPPPPDDHGLLGTVQ
jgi:hypothetical protein